jgi:hypothetical protein
MAHAADHGGQEKRCDYRPYTRRGHEQTEGLRADSVDILLKDRHQGLVGRGKDL